MSKNGEGTPRCNYIINLGNGGNQGIIYYIVNWKLGNTKVSLIAKRFLSVVSAIDP